MFEFEWIYAFLLLPLPFLVHRFIPAVDKNTLVIKTKIAGSGLSFDLNKSISNKFNLIVVAIVWVLLVVSVSRPVFIDNTSNNSVQPARDLMLAVDISGSMSSQDMIVSGLNIGSKSTTRLQVVKKAMNRFILNRQGDRVGLILFGDKAYLQSPLTLDVKTVNKLLQESRVGFAGRSTAIGDAIGLGIKRLNNASNTDAVLLLLTDGADTSSFIPPRKAADIAAKNNIKIYTIGVAPSKNAGSLGSFFGLSSGSDLDEGLLKYIADKTKAKYFKATSLGQLDDIYSTIDNLEKINRNYLNIYPQISLYYYPLALALIIVFVYLSFYFARRFFYKK